MVAPSPRIVWSPEAETDLLSIWHWGAARFSPDVADGHLRDIQISVDGLRANPLIGRARDDLMPGVRSIVIFPTIVFYRVGARTIDIIRVSDGRRNLAAIFSHDGGN